MPSHGKGRAPRFAAERELLGVVVLGGALAAIALLPESPLAPADLSLAAVALGSGLALLWVGSRFR